VKTRLVLFLLFVTNLAYAQQWDSLNLTLPTDSILQNSIAKADSITNAFQTKADSLNNLYQSQFTKIESERSNLQSKIDSLTNLKLPTEKLTHKLDSLNQLKSTKLASLTKEVDALKAKATNAFKDVHLPPQMQEPFDKLKSSLQGYSLPALNTDISGIPNLEMPKLESIKLPTLSNQLALDPNLKDITGNLNKIQSLAGKAGEYTQDAQNLVKGNLDEVKNIDKAIESQVLKVEGMDQLTKGKGMLGQTSQLTDSAAMKEKAKELVQEMVMNAAQDHFAGKQEVLQQAMDKMSKLKSKYSEVQSMAELPKKLPNPLKGKPFIERLVPGVTFQIQTSNYFLLDVNALLMYRISPRFSAGAGWNQRLPFDKLEIKSEQRIYGPRATIEFKWTKGINFRLLPEIMNTAIPPTIAHYQGIDPAYREWVPSVFVGIKKDFTVYKQIKGNTEVLYNLYDPHDYSPYGDRLAVRFGFEFPMKKRVKKVKVE
jgi:predicted nuclease with TOPRIM domain